MDYNLLVGFLEHFTYFTIFITLALVGFVIPLPEEIMILVVGYVSAMGFGSLPTTIIVSIIGVTCGDNIIYRLSRKGSSLSRHLKAKVKKSRLIKYESFMKEHVGLAIFGLRFIVGLRMFSPFIAGIMKVRWIRFQIYDLLALVIYVPTLVFLGYHFHNQLADIIAELQVLRHILFFGATILLGIAITVFVKNKVYKKEPS